MTLPAYEFTTIATTPTLAIKTTKVEFGADATAGTIVENNVRFVNTHAKLEFKVTATIEDGANELGAIKADSSIAKEAIEVYENGTKMTSGYEVLSTGAITANTAPNAWPVSIKINTAPGKTAKTYTIQVD